MTSSNLVDPAGFVPFLLEHLRLHQRVVGFEEIVRLFLEAKSIDGKIIDELLGGGKNV